MHKAFGFSSICPNCNYIDFFGTSYYNLNPNYSWRCWRCGYKLDYRTFMFGINIQDLIEEGFDMRICGKECNWVRVDPENTPDEIELLGECTVQGYGCPYCHALHQQFIELSKVPYKIGILCPECNAIYFGEWTEIKDDKHREENKEIIIKTSDGIKTTEVRLES